MSEPVSGKGLPFSWLERARAVVQRVREKRGEPERRPEWQREQERREERQENDHG